MKRSFLALLALMLLLSTLLLVSSRVQAAACAAPSTDYGTATMTITAPATGSYRVWSRISAPDTTNNSYSLEIDGTNCYTVGDSQLPVNTWTWVDYQNANAASKVDVSLSAGTHTFKLVGREPNVAVDRVLIVSDTTCVPTDTGGNCLIDADQTPPTVAMTSPAAGATVSGNVNITAAASDVSGIAKVEFYVDGTLKGTSTTTPYTYSWNTGSITNGSHAVSAKAYDKLGNVSSDGASVTVQNGDTQAPSAPTNLTAAASSPTAVDLKWTASTDNVGVIGYIVQRNNVTLAQLGNVTTYKDSTAVANTAYTYRVIAADAAGNLSQPSAAKSVTTPQPPTADREAPSVPASLSATATSSSQVNLSWNASTDNVAVAKYHVYRIKGTDPATKVASLTTTSFGDTGLKAGTAYSYYVTAEDGSGNVSAASAKVGATTLPKTNRGKKGHISGTLKLEGTRKQGGAHVIIWVQGDKRTYHTNHKGEYNIGRLPAGTYKVRYYGHDEIHASDYRPQTFSITVEEGQQVTKNVTLKKK